MIYELRTYTLYPGKVKEFLALFEKGSKARDKYSKTVGVWYTEIGELNQVVFLREYEDLNHRMRAKEAGEKDPEWVAIREQLRSLLLKQENKILIPAAFSGLK